MHNYNILNDKELTGLLQQGDEYAFTEIYNRYWNRLFTVAANKIKDLDDAEEIVQDIFVSLWKRRGELGVIDTLSSYLAVSVKYRVIKILNKLNNRQKYSSYSKNNISIADDSTQEWLEFEELRSRLTEFVAELPEKCRLVYKLSRDSGYSQKKIASELGISEKTVEAHLGKAIKTLRTRLGQFLL
ncbi:RNA polymerase sigma-70 factor [Mucilaginibacter sp. BJC16-A38]|uniref:RNA polymerase sigma-70 factor n=1 Tax=Mucilaginibacter phenanthrenivorans TaxID=1234842 RepID=UPI00215715E8|nr:RNA polymerase sigma-70 factor [Mucilaginibacter phenanthrenivorans]MCR8556466.1 RNA polymerase sigma-70 factor [Mucilaginibacter phenanthrenivorans]